MLSNNSEQSLDFEDSTMAMFVRILSQSLGRTVVNKTGLTGRYNFKLHWAADMDRMMMGGPGPGGPGPMGGGTGAQAAGMAPAPAPSGPSIFTAIQEQLGLRLKPEKGPVPVLVIDHIEPPTPD